VSPVTGGVGNRLPLSVTAVGFPRVDPGGVRNGELVEMMLRPPHLLQRSLSLLVLVGEVRFLWRG
jgi:hypothetical protein